MGTGHLCILLEKPPLCRGYPPHTFLEQIGSLPTDARSCVSSSKVGWCWRLLKTAVLGSYRDQAFPGGGPGMPVGAGGQPGNRVCARIWKPRGPWATPSRQVHTVCLFHAALCLVRPSAHRPHPHVGLWERAARGTRGTMSRVTRPGPILLLTVGDSGP